jgi:mRNA interferase MazF
MNVRRGDVVLVDFPFSGGKGTKVRPALVIQNDQDNSRLLNTIVAQITGTTHRALESTQVPIEATSTAGRQTGVRFDSVINCVNIVTLDKSLVLRRLGHLTSDHLSKVEHALKVALQLS